MTPSVTEYDRNATGNLFSYQVSIIGFQPGKHLLVGGQLTIETARKFVGKIVTVPSVEHGKNLDLKLESVRQDEQGDIRFWGTVDGKVGGSHYRLLAKKD